ncbi:coproporphyrinogen dehydrogenase HemZ [Peptostreptococcaceae bacterium AS15]|nr:coproporphyrinogen dehydrogenase HemZ [Peptostreptococcaceae bacterium AS15]
MIIVSDNKKYNIELKELGDMLFAKKIEVRVIDQEQYLELSDISNQDIIRLEKVGDKVRLSLSKSDVLYEDEIDIDFKEKLIYKKLLYKAICKNYENISPKWGILTGIRPVKIVNDLKKEGLKNQLIDDILREKYMISAEKSALIRGISDIQEEIISRLDKKISLYISIPFCPSRCNYCSFFSMDINKGKKFVDDYLKNLEIEIRHTLSMPYFKDKKISSVYVGGGTPSSLDYDELRRFFKIINDNFNINEVDEFTFEAGRVDTLDEEKLRIIFQNKVDRISINPQTMNDITFGRIGRNHNSKDVREIFTLARQIGFDNINMDLIMGLTGESIEDMRYSVEEIVKLDPESITVHCLAVKRASDINTKKIKTDNLQISDLMQEVNEKLQTKGYEPYYLYRQKNMLENGENIGYCKKGRYSLYNVAMMDEIQTIIGFGACSSTKILDEKTNLISRVPNYKDVILYNNNINEMLKRKEVLL